MMKMLWLVVFFFFSPFVFLYANTSVSSQKQFLVGARAGLFFVPESILQATFFDEADGVIQGGAGLEFVIRTSPTFEYQIGLTYFDLRFKEGQDRYGNPIVHPFLNKGKAIQDREYMLNSMSYIGLDVRFMKHFPVHRYVSILVGGGVGLGFVLGDLKRQRVLITSAQTSEQRKANYEKYKDGGQQDPKVLGSTPYGTPFVEDRVPPVIPIAEFLFGVNFPIHRHFEAKILFGFGLPQLFSIGLGLLYHI